MFLISRTRKTWGHQNIKLMKHRSKFIFCTRICSVWIKGVFIIFKEFLKPSESDTYFFYCRDQDPYFSSESDSHLEMRFLGNNTLYYGQQQNNLEL